MPDKRMIDANALPVHRGFISYDVGIVHGRFVAVDDIENAPTIDAVEVVRCKDCRESDYYYTHDPDGMYCAVWDTVVRCNGYCDHGAKMDEKEDKPCE